MRRVCSSPSPAASLADRRRPGADRQPATANVVARNPHDQPEKLLYVRPRPSHHRRADRPSEYLKRDEQIMVLREQQEQAFREQLEKDQKAAQFPPDTSIDGELKDEAAEEAEVERFGSKIIVLHPGSQNLRVGLASDALPKSIPNVIARRAEKSECEVEEPAPKRVKLDIAENSSGDDEDAGKVSVEPEVCLCLAGRAGADGRSWRRKSMPCRTS